MAIIDESVFEPVPTQKCFPMLFNDILYQFEMEIDSRTTFSHRKTKTATKLTDKAINFYAQTAHKMQYLLRKSTHILT